MTLKQINDLDAKEAYIAFEKCCGASNWIIHMVNNRPYKNIDELYYNSEASWSRATEKDGLEAFLHHPQIGDKSDHSKTFEHTKDWAENEQGGIKKASETILDNLAAANKEYLEKFGFIFIVFATGKSAQEMLDLLLERMDNDKDNEIRIAMTEQNKITRIRLEKLLQ